MVTAPPVVMFTTASVACLMRGKNCMKTDASDDGRPSFGSRACKCRMAAPGLGGIDRLRRDLVGRDRQRIRHGRRVDRARNRATDDDLRHWSVSPCPAD